MLRYKTKTRAGLVALYDIRPGNGASPFLQPRRSSHGAEKEGKGRGGDRGGSWGEGKGGPPSYCWTRAHQSLATPLIFLMLYWKWMAPWENRISSTTMKLRKSLVKPVMRQNISSCLVLPPEIVMQDAFNVILWASAGICVIVHDDHGWKNWTTRYNCRFSAVSLSCMSKHWRKIVRHLFDGKKFAQSVPLVEECAEHHTK